MTIGDSDNDVEATLNNRCGHDYVPLKALQYMVLLHLKTLGLCTTEFQHVFGDGMLLLRRRRRREFH